MNLNVNATLDLVVDKQPELERPIPPGMLSLQNLDQARSHARGSAMKAAAALDTMRVIKLIAEPLDQHGIELLEGIVAMLTKMT